MIVILAAWAVLAAGCAGNVIDNPSGADNVLEIQSLNALPVTATADDAGACTFLVQNWTGVMENVPVNPLAAAGSRPFNDIVLESVTISYDWIGGVATTPPRTIGMSSIVVPAAGTRAFNFPPILFQDLTSDVVGQSANLTLVFNAHTVEGELVRLVVHASTPLSVETCTAP